MSASLRELYPTGSPSLEAHQELLHRHARKLESGIARDMAANERHTELEEKVDKIDREMSEQTQALIDIKLAMARGEGDTKRLGVWLALAGPIITALLMAAITYAMRPASGPGPTHLTTEQIEQLKANDEAAKR